MRQECTQHRVYPVMGVLGLPGVCVRVCVCACVCVEGVCGACVCTSVSLSMYTQTCA